MNGATSGRKRPPKKATDLEARVQALTLEITRTQEALQSAIAERSQAEERLARSEEKFETFLESASEGIVAIDASGRVALVNARAEAMFGYNRKELIGQPLEMLLPERLRDVHAGHRQGYLAEPRTRPMGIGLELFGRRKDGTEFPVEIGLGSLKSGETFLATSFIADITERKRAEEELRKSEGRLAAAQAIAHLGSYELHLDGSEKAYWSEETYHIIGIAPSQKALTREDYIQRIVHPEDRLLVWREVEDSIRECKLFDRDHRIVMADGTVKHVHSVAQPVTNKAGKVVKLVGTIRDVTESKRTQEELFRRGREFKALVENSPDVISRLDRNLRYLYANPAIEEVLGLKPQHCLGKSRSELGLPEKLWKPWDQQSRQAFETGRETVFDFSIQRANGPRHHQCRIVPEFGEDGTSVESVLCITYDVTDLKRAEEVHSRLASIVEGSNDAIISETLEGVIVSWNEAAERIYGYSAAEAIGHSVTMLIPTDHADEMATIIARIKRGESVSHYETVRRRKDGSQIEVSLTISPLRDATGKITGASAILRDITEQKKAAEQARWHELRLLQTDKMASLGVLVSGMAHEINNPNNYILLNSRIISKVWNDAKPILEEYYQKAGDFPLAGMPYSQAHEKIGQLVSGIAEGTQRIQKIVQSLKDFARKDTGNLNQAVNVNAVVQSGLVIMNSLIKKSTDFFSVEYGQDLPTVQGNSQQLEQVIINLVANACQALPNKEMKVAVATCFDKEASKIMIDIKDEGIGISPENLKFILDPFFTTKRDEGGTGLGLSASHTIVKNHGGELTFASQLGKGTTATIILPAKT